MTSVETRAELGNVEAHGLVGRKLELRALARLLEQTGDGPAVPRLVEVAGAPGIGKTEVLNELARMAQARGVAVRNCRMPFPRSGTRFGLFRDAFDGQLELNRVGDAADGHHGVAETVRGLLERLADPALVLIIDDAHAADSASLELMASLLRRPPRAAVLFALGYRDRQAPLTLRSVIDARSQEITATQIRLGPLTEQDVEVIVANAGTRSWRHELYCDSGGNPAYLGALLAERLTFAIRPDDTRPDLVTRFGDPAIFLSELDGTSPCEQAVAYAAAVVGDDFDAELVARTLDEPESAVLDAIETLLRLDIVRPVARGRYFTFRHPVVRRAIYEGCELSRQTRLHARIDEVLRAQGASAVARAPHVEQRARHGDLDAVDLLVEASDTAGATRPATAAAWLTTALRVLPHHPRFAERRGRLLVRLARAVAASGHLRDARDLLHQALPLLPKQPRTEHSTAVVFTALVQRMLGAYAETDALLHKEIQAVSAGTQDSAALKFELAAGKLKSGDLAGCSSWARDALETACQHDDRRLQVACLGVMAKADGVEGHLETAQTSLSSAAMILDGMLDSEFAAGLETAEWVGWSEIVLDRWDDALRHFNKAVDFAVRADHRLVLPHLLVGKVFALRNKGRLQDAWTAAEHAVDLAVRSGCPEQLVAAHAMLAWTDAHLGRVDQAVVNAQLAAASIGDTISGWRDAFSMRLLAEARLLTGDHEGCLTPVGMLGGPNLPSATSYTRVAWYELFTRAEVAAGRPDYAAKWAESAASAAGQLPQPSRAGLAELARAQALLAQNPESALPCAQRALANLEQSGMMLEALRARQLLGVALGHHDRFDDALRELKCAQQAFEELDAVPFARTARTERRRLAAKASRTSATGRLTDNAATLTLRERQIAELVREGLTNRLISRKLHIAEKTVEMHLSKVFAKLGVSNRAAVAVFLTREEDEHTVSSRK